MTQVIVIVILIVVLVVVYLFLRKGSTAQAPVASEPNPPVVNQPNPPAVSEDINLPATEEKNENSGTPQV